MSDFQFHEKESVSLYLDNLELIEDISSDLQCVQVYNHIMLGKVLIINDEIQHVEKWMPYYHESIVHIPMMFIEKPENVLILGGGDLFAAQEVLKYESIKNVVLCDYDENVIRVTRRYYKHANEVLNDKRFHLVIDDARNYIKKCTIKFDLVIDDCFNLVETFDNESIFSDLKKMLNENGICSSLVYRHIFETSTNKKTFQRLISNHNTVLSLITVPEYPGILHLLTIWGNAVNLKQNLNKSVNINHLQDITFIKRCKLFNPRFCDFYLFLPNYIKNIFNKEEVEE